MDHTAKGHITILHSRSRSREAQTTDVSMKIDIAKASMEEKNVVSCPTRLSSREQRNLAKLCARKDVHIVAACGIFEDDNKYKSRQVCEKNEPLRKKNIGFLSKPFLSLWRQS